MGFPFVEWWVMCALFHQKTKNDVTPDSVFALVLIKDIPRKIGKLRNYLNRIENTIEEKQKPLRVDRRGVVFQSE